MALSKVVLAWYPNIILESSYLLNELFFTKFNNFLIATDLWTPDINNFSTFLSLSISIPFSILPDPPVKTTATSAEINLGCSYLFIVSTKPASPKRKATNNIRQK